MLRLKVMLFQTNLDMLSLFRVMETDMLQAHLLQKQVEQMAM
jgi:hypothetical protein